jgi:hypothetical protein
MHILVCLSVVLLSIMSAAVEMIKIEAQEKQRHV